MLKGFVNTYWTPLDEEIASTVMRWKLVPLSEHPEMWPAWPRDTKFRLAWMVEDPEDTICSIEAEPGTGTDGKWSPIFIPPLSTDMAWATKVSSACLKRGGYLRLMQIENNFWAARFDTLPMLGRTSEFGSSSAGFNDENPAMAICKAALLFCEKNL